MNWWDGSGILFGRREEVRPIVASNEAVWSER